MGFFILKSFEGHVLARLEDVAAVMQENGLQVVDTLQTQSMTID
jgi:hypothetical protein